jgi:hypothetical protein
MTGSSGSAAGNNLTESWDMIMFEQVLPADASIDESSLQRLRDITGVTYVQIAQHPAQGNIHNTIIYSHTHSHTTEVYIKDDVSLKSM